MTHVSKAISSISLIRILPVLNKTALSVLPPQTITR